MNHSDRDALKLMSRSISHPNKQQRLLNNMQHISNCDDFADAILQIALNNTDGTTILSNLATALGVSCQTEACIVISGGDRFQTEGVGHWQNKSDSIAKDVKALIYKLSALSLSCAAHKSSLIEPTSPLFDKIALLLEHLDLTYNWLGITVLLPNQTNGFILLLKPQSVSWTQTERKSLKQNFNPIAIAISQAQLQQQSRTKSRYQNLLKHLSREISQGYQPQLLLENCLAEVAKTLQVDCGSILMLKYRNPLKAKDRKRDSVKGTAKIACQWNKDSQHSASDNIAFNLIDSELCQKAWRNAPQCLHFSNQALFPDLNVDSVTTQGEALLMMPLMGKKTSEIDSAMVLGFLILQNELPRSWSQDELDLVDWVGMQIGTAIVQHQTLNRVQLIVDERTAQLQSSMDMQGKLAAKMRQHIEQLQKLNQLKDDFMNSMSHELKTPLASMKLAIKMLRQPEISPDKRERYLDILEQEWQREYSLIKDLLTLQQVESGELDYSPQELELDRTITALSQSFIAKWQSDRDIDLTCTISPRDLKIYTDAESLKHILQELLTNAGKYADANTTVELAVTDRLIDKQEQVQISVANTGAGILPEELPHIFDKFRRGKGVTDRAVPGTGLGLTLLQYFVEHLNGAIEVTSKPLTDDSTVFLTTFVLKLPQIKPDIS